MCEHVNALWTCVCSCLTCLRATQQVLRNHHNDSGKGRHGKSIRRSGWKEIQLPYLAHATVESLGPDVPRRTPIQSMPWQRNALAPRWKLIYSCTVFLTEVAMSFQIAALYWIKAIKKTTPRPPQRNEHTTAQNTSKQLAHSESKQNVHSIPSYFMRKNPWCFMSTKNCPQSNQQDTVDGPAKSESPVDMVVNIPLFIGFQPSFFLVQDFAGPSILC